MIYKFMKGYDQGNLLKVQSFSFHWNKGKYCLLLFFGKKWNYVTLSIGQMYGLADVGNIWCAIMLKICDNIGNMLRNIMYLKWSKIG